MPKAYKKSKRRQKRRIRGRRVNNQLQELDNDATRAYRKKLRYWKDNDQEESDVSTANEFFEPVLSEDYDRILLPQEVRKVDDLYLKQKQIDQIFTCLQQSTGNQKILFISSSEILSDRVLPSVEYVKFIVLPIFDRERNVLLAAFDLSTRIPWRFFKPLLFKYQYFKIVKDALERKLKARFGPDYIFENDQRPRDCARLVVERTYPYNDGILVCRAAEDLFFSGWVKLWDSFDVNAERERFQRIFDIINNDWDGVWPANNGGDISSMAESDNSVVEDDASSNLDGSNEAFIDEEDVAGQIDDNHFNDFDDRQSPLPVSDDASEELLSHDFSRLSFLSSDISLQPGSSSPTREQLECAPSALGPYAAVFLQSPRSDHSRRHSYSRSPPLPKPTSSKSSTDTTINNFLLDDVSISNISAPIFDISDVSERGSLGFKDERNILDWSPGLLNDQRVENSEQEDKESTETTTEEATVLTQIDELPLDRSVEATVKEIESLFKTMWPQIQSLTKVEDVDSLVAPVFNSEDPNQRYLDAYRRLIAATFVSEIQSTIKKRIPFSTVQEFKKHITDALLQKLSIERKNDLLDARHVWVRKNPEFMKTVQARQDKQDLESQIVNDCKRELVCKAIAAEDIINYSNEHANRFTDIGFNECVEFLRKHAPEQLDALLAQYDN
uniref:Uncharacterized protein n=1 Tax=Panagrolaimus sp. ES5 TaxID=591445 RepID=A0AC34GNL9_9BILA